MPRVGAWRGAAVFAVLGFVPAACQRVASPTGAQTLPVRTPAERPARADAIAARSALDQPESIPASSPASSPESIPESIPPAEMQDPGRDAVDGQTRPAAALFAGVLAPMPDDEQDHAVGPPRTWPDGCVDDPAQLPTAAGLTPRRERRLREGTVLVAHKGRRRMMLFEAGTLRACWRIALGWTPQGHKQVEGDGKTPVGWYRTSDKPWSSFDDAIAIHYPATRDAQAARADGRITAAVARRIAAAHKRGRVPPQRTAMGGAILIHGGGSAQDWTAGCIALDEADLAQLRTALPKGMRTDLLIVE